MSEKPSDQLQLTEGREPFSSLGAFIKLEGSIMPHFAKPWFRKSRGVWMVQIAGTQHNLGPDQEIAFRRYYDLMRQPVKKVVVSESVVGVIDLYLEWCKEHRAAETYEWYRWRLQLFAASIGANLTVAQLKHYHLDEWLRLRPDWSSGTKRGMARAVQRALRWATRKGYIDRSPIADYEKPRPGKRHVVISAEAFETILRLVRTNAFRDLLMVTWETGCRPQESLAVEARHVDLANTRWVFPADEAKGQQWPRIVYLTDKALEITKQMTKRHRKGPMFRNANGKPWTTDAVNCRFNALQHRMGRLELKRRGLDVEADAVQSLIPSLKPAGRFDGVSRPKTPSELEQEARKKCRQKLATKHAPKHCLYQFRHSWLDRALKRGVDALTAAILMGHRDPSTIAKVYQHLAQSPDYLLNAAKKAAS
jgi:integrase